MLARLFARPANVLVLDEPTNDLDIETLELLEELIGDFDGTVLLVSHDRIFLDHLVTSTLAFEGGGQVTEYVGGWEDYLRQKPSTPNLQAATANEPAARSARPHSRVPSPHLHQGTGRQLEPQAPEKRKLSYKEQRELETLPAHIEALEAEQERLRTASESPQFYRESADHIKGVLARLDAIAPALEQALARWMELEERR
jgi:ATP-binding cassette subfamily F protein uup